MRKWSVEQDGARDVFLCVSSFNPRARALHERLGYQSIGELTDFVIAGASELLLRKRLVADFAGSVKQTVRRVFAAEADDVLSLVEEYYDAVQVVGNSGRRTNRHQREPDHSSGVLARRRVTTRR